MTQEHLVEWSINLDANDPLDAARQALDIHRDPQSTAVVFFVTAPEAHGERRRFRIDLDPPGHMVVDPPPRDVALERAREALRRHRGNRLNEEEDGDEIELTALRDLADAFEEFDDQ